MVHERALQYEVKLEHEDWDIPHTMRAKLDRVAPPTKPKVMSTYNIYSGKQCDSVKLSVPEEECARVRP